MALPIEFLLLQMREHQHLPGMPRIHGKTTTATCLRCGAWGSVEARPRRRRQPLPHTGRALLADCAAAQ